MNAATGQPIIEARNLSKLYRLGGMGFGTLREAAQQWWSQRRGRHGSASERGAANDFWALKDVSFDVQPGEVVGFIGRNGAGKSTLLKILSRITEPTSGGAVLRGRVASLLEVGTGFHPDLTGRENVYLNGAILGMKRAEIAAKFDEIIEFSEIGQFIDTPVKRYSSGMFVRLAFAVAAHLDPEILIVDEVLAVGDADFQKKCLGKMRDVSSGEGRTVLFVSHNMNAVKKLCTRAILLEGGTVLQQGDTATVVARYLTTGVSQASTNLWQHPNRAAAITPWLERIEITDQRGEPRHSVAAGETVQLTVHIRCAQPVWDPRVSIGFTDATGERVFAVANFLSSSAVGTLRGAATVTASFTMPPVIPSQYVLDIGLSDGSGRRLDEIYGAAQLEIAETNHLGTSHPYFREMGYILVPSTWNQGEPAADEGALEEHSLHGIGY